MAEEQLESTEAVQVEPAVQETEPAPQEPAPESAQEPLQEPAPEPAQQPAQEPEPEQEPAQQPAQEPSRPQPVVINQYTRRSGNEPVFGQFVDVVSGEHANRYGHYFADVSHDKDGYPDRILVRSRDARNEILEVNLADVRPSERLGGR